MGFTNFLTGIDLKEQNQVPEVTEELRRTSIAFVSAFQTRNPRLADSATVAAMKCFDYIIGELLRARDGGDYLPGSPFLTVLAEPAAMFIEIANKSEHVSVRSAGAGNWRPAGGHAAFRPISFAATLNKIKHRHPLYANFRIEGDRHIFIVCPVAGAGQKSGIAEFDVQAFCDQCERAALAM